MTLDLQVRKQVPTISDALKALTRMERELTTEKTYEQIRRVIKEAKAIQILFGHVQEVKAKAEDTILAASIRIGEEIKKVPKAPGPGRGKKTSSRAGKSLTGRSATGVPKTSRSRLTKLADAGITATKKAAEQLREQGKDATPRAVATFLTQGDKKERRATRETELAAKQRAMPDSLYGVIYADPPWKFEPFSRDTGMDRAADNHYPTMDVAAIAAIKVPAAPDCVLFLWATVPMLFEALNVMGAWGFIYKSNFAWVKDKAGTGFWNKNKHEFLLIGTRGNIPAPAPGEQFESVLVAPRGAHSAKPFAFREMIEEMFPSLPRIELFAREKFAGWDVWGFEAPEAAA